MQTSRNPKVLNRALRYKLQPLEDKVADLEALDEQNEKFIEETETTEKSLMSEANSKSETYKKQRAVLENTIQNSNNKLAILIKNELYNPNTSGSVSSQTGGSAETEIEETKLISDKVVTAIGFGYVKDGIDYAIIGISGKGLCKGTIPYSESEYDWLNPNNDKEPFPSFYINDVLKISEHIALISTNIGIVKYNIEDSSYVTYGTDYGLPNKEVKTVIPVVNGETKGYIALTNGGVAYSPTGERWNKVDTSFTDICTCGSNIELVDTPQSIVFIGTGSGVRLFNTKTYLEDEVKEVPILSGLNAQLPSSYINGLSYDTTRDVLAISTVGGLTIVEGISEILSSGRSVTASDCTLYTSRDGLPGTACYGSLFTVNHKLIVGTSNGLGITENLRSFNVITRTNNTENDTNQILSSHICNKIVRELEGTYAILHGVGISEGIVIE